MIKKYSATLSLVTMLIACNSVDPLEVEVYETSANGNQLKQISEFKSGDDNALVIKLLPDETFQTITGFGGSFTESSAYLLNQLSLETETRFWKLILVKVALAIL